MSPKLLYGTVIALSAVLLFHSCSKELSCEGCIDKNKAPIAVAGPDTLVTLPTDSLVLDGSKSSDPDGTISSWQWTKVSGPASFTIVTVTSAKTVVKSLKSGVYQFELMVTDDGGLSAKDTVQIMVDDPGVNQPPVAKAGPDAKITLPTDSVLLDGTGSFDVDGTITSYKWVKVTGPASANILLPDSARTIGKALIAGVYQFELTVKDNGGLSAKDTVIITIDSMPTNHPPSACAGADQTITLPTNTAVLNGNCSTDPDNNIATYQWTKITGPSSFSIANANAAQTQAGSLTEGVYQFELKVTDAGGLFDRDTLQLTVKAAAPLLTCGNANRPTVPAQLIHVGTLSEPRSWISVAAAGNKILFNGGYLGNVICEGSRKVDIYDIAANTWSVQYHSPGIPGSGDYYMGVAVAGSKIFFAGGDILLGCTDIQANTIVSYDVTTNKWDSIGQSTAALGIAAASVGNKVLFAGGTGFNASSGTKVDIYDLTTNAWTSASLSEARYGHAAITVNNKVYFIGGLPVNGPSSTIDIYNNATNSWSTASLQRGRANFGALAVNDKLYLAGGQKGTASNYTGTCELEIMDVNTGASVIESLSRPAVWNIDLGQNIVLKDNKIVFLRFDGAADADKFDIYDITTKSWSIGVLPQPIPKDASVISVNNIIYIAGGLVNGIMSDQVWKLEF